MLAYITIIQTSGHYSDYTLGVFSSQRLIVIPKRLKEHHRLCNILLSLASGTFLLGNNPLSALQAHLALALLPQALPSLHKGHLVWLTGLANLHTQTLC